MPSAEDMQTLENMYVERLQQPFANRRWRELTAAITQHRQRMGVMLNDELDRQIFARAEERAYGHLGS